MYFSKHLDKISFISYCLPTHVHRLCVEADEKAVTK